MEVNDIKSIVEKHQYGLTDKDVDVRSLAFKIRESLNKVVANHPESNMNTLSVGWELAKALVEKYGKKITEPQIHAEVLKKVTAEFDIEVLELEKKPKPRSTGIRTIDVIMKDVKILGLEEVLNREVGVADSDGNKITKKSIRIELYLGGLSPMDIAKLHNCHRQNILNAIKDVKGEERKSK